jgi:predicted PurR-regulated permease PerM
MESAPSPLPETRTRCLRVAGLAVIALAVLWSLIALREALTPIFASLVLAYILNPLVCWAERRGLSRLLATVIIFCAAGLSVACAGLFGARLAIDQVEALRRDVPRYLPVLQDLTMRTQAGQSPAAAQLWQKFVEFATQQGLALADAAVKGLVAAGSSVLAVLTLLVLVPAYTFVFLWRFDWLIATIRDHLPLAWRETIVRIFGIVDRAVANFFRGRLLVCLAVGLLTAAGWTLTGVPFGAWLGLAAGALNLIPFMSLLVLPVALGFRYLAAIQADADWAVPLALVFGVYFVVQLLESFVLSPLVESRASGLHPLTVVAALLIGQQCAGLLGMLLAIPAAGTLKALAVEFVVPELRRLAGRAQTATRPAEPTPEAPDREAHR